MKLSNFCILTPNLLGIRPLLLFAVLSCFDWILFACNVSISFLVITFSDNQFGILLSKFQLIFSLVQKGA